MRFRDEVDDDGAGMHYGCSEDDGCEKYYLPVPISLH